MIQQFPLAILFLLKVPLNGAALVSFDDTTIDKLNHRLVFTSESSLSQKVRELKTIEEDRSDTTASLQPLYQQGFKPLVPAVNDENDVYFTEYEARRYEEAGVSAKSLTTNDDDEIDIDDGDPIVADDAFAALLNDKREVQVGSSVYKYTAYGVFVATPSQMSAVEKTIATMEKNEPINLFHRRRTTAASDNTELNCEIQMERIVIEEGIELYKSAGCKQVEEDRKLIFEDHHCHRHLRGELSLISDPCGGTGGSWPTPPSPTPPTPTPPAPTPPSHDQAAANYINSLDYCDASSGTLDFLFGTSRKCISKFGSKHRVKTRFWNQNYVVYTSIGVSVKNQKKSWGIWWTRSTDELRLGISQAYFEIVVPVPDINSILQQNSISFEWQGGIYNRWGSFIQPSSSSSLPNFPFDISDNNPILIYVDLPKVLGHNIDQTVTAKDINDLFWQQLWSQARSLVRSLGSPEPQSAVMTGFTNNRVVVNLVDESFQKFNSKKITEIFDSDWGFQIKFGWSDSGGFGTPEPQTVELADFTNVAVDFYGVARSGSTWRGSRIQYEG